MSLKSSCKRFIVRLDEPKSTKPWWMTEKEREMCVERLANENRDAMSATWDLSAVKRILTSWQLWAFCVALGVSISQSILPRTNLFTVIRTMECTCGVNLQRWMTLYLKSVKVDGHAKYSVEKINNLPTVVGCVVSISCSTYSSLLT
jgi:ACS family pantothenate transporter-like MFS transporter